MQTNSGGNTTSEKVIRSVLDGCADCDTCRFLMDECCLLFPELYRLYDEEKEHGRPIGEDELQRLSELCTLCGLCPCPDIRMDVIRGKTERVRRKGMPMSIRLLADVQRFGRLSTLAPKAFNRILSFPPVCSMAKKVAGIHSQRKLPRIAGENFFAWARRQGLDRKPHRSPKAAYFAGCTAGYFFPEVARAAVAVLSFNGISVHVPPQQCCGMPTLLEGDERTTLERVRFNLEVLLKTARTGYDLVCSCPTCGFLLRILLRENACYSDAYQKSVNATADEIKIPAASAEHKGFIRLKKSMYHKILTDDGYFHELNPLERIALSESVMDMGQYLKRLHREKRLNTRFGRIDSRAAYFAPCHQREQGIGRPYEKLLQLIPGLTVVSGGGAMDCCGMGGSLGFKKDFHEASLNLAQPLMRKIQAADPTVVITDCLSCRLQFQHMLPFPVFHPLELISQAYELGRDEKEER
ncbi:MAG: FeS-binding protein [Desulfobacteraceae bacterium]|nr:MAG: FeS-binding protein [Desulfobacteraceae bacterium]